MLSIKNLPTKIAIIGGSLIGAILTYSYLKYKPNKQQQQQQQQELRSSLTLQTTKKIVQEIKYQMLLLCMVFTQKFKEYLQTNLNQEEIQILSMKLRQNMMKFYQQKETIIIEKYHVSKQLFEQAIKEYKQDESIIKNQEEIRVMMERAIKGKLPDFSVPQEALKLFSLDEIRDTYQQLSFNVARLVWNKMMECIKSDPHFSAKNDEDFKKAIRSISIYDYKLQYLVQKGVKTQWGCPNQTFFKIIQINKNQNPQFKEKIINIQRAYEVLIDKVSHFPQEITEQGLKLLFQAKINNNQKNSRPNKGPMNNGKKPTLNKLKGLTDEYKQFIGKKEEKQEDVMMMNQFRDVIKSNANPVTQW